MALLGGSSASGGHFAAKMIVFALVVAFLTPVCFTLFAPAVTNGEPWQESIKALEEEYYNSTGHVATSTTEIWALSGVYTPYSGGEYAETPDGWIYGDRIVNYEIEQYPDIRAQYDATDGLYYYSAVDSENKTHAVGDLYTAVSFDRGHKSNVFFTADGKTDIGNGYYYNYNGYRYAFSPVRSYLVETSDGTDTALQVQPKSSTLSLIFYQYATYEGIAGQLSLAGSDSGLSYLSAADIVKAFNSATYSSTFNMVFNKITMHLTIKLDIARLTAGMSPETAFNQGYWSIVVSSDAAPSKSINDASYSFNIDNIFNTLISMFTFSLTDDYDIDGWLAILASIMLTMPLYAALIAIALDNYYILIGVALLGVIQAGASWWPF